MTSGPVVLTEIEKARMAWMAEHLGGYLKSGGAQGHLIDFREIGGHHLTPTLLLRTIGRKSGQPRTLPLIYGIYGSEVVIVASKGGADVHPAWYVNIKGGKEVAIQIATQAFRTTWREPQGAERTAVWDYMVKLYPPYADYQKATKRQIPLVMLTTGDAIPVFKS